MSSVRKSLSIEERIVNIQEGEEMQMPLVSIIVPIYNQEKYLRKSIPCLLNQTYRNIQILLVNDGSTDQSDAIIKEYKSKDNRIKVVNKTNGGLVDATIAGVQASDGDYIAFLDPDDYVGNDFIERFVNELDEDYDFVAAGFYYDRCGNLNPYIIENSVKFNQEAIRKLRNTYLYFEQEGKISQQIFFARWNKLYKAETVKKVVEEFKQCKGVTLGEDTIFTFLLLSHSEKGKSIKGVNSYYYNTGNQNSMMKSKKIVEYLGKAKRAYTEYIHILNAYGGNEKNAVALYFFLIESIYNSLDKTKEEFKELYSLLKNDDIYKKAVKYIYDTTASSRQKVSLFLRLYCPYSKIYSFLMNDCIKGMKGTRDFFRECNAFINNSKRVGFGKSVYLSKFRRQRKNAFNELNRLMPEMDARISMIIKGLRLAPAQESIERNIFVFWWDGFDTAPDIVKKCLQSVENNYGKFNIVKISKDNYMEYTDIDPLILKGFKDGRVSVQTFSDILRFNLLKNNGGMWIDATIFFLNEYDLMGKLDENQSFNTLEFASSGEFLKYKGQTCSWSGFFIASKKNGMFVRIMDAIFREYFKKYGTYTLYFFIDAAFMTCKVNGVDDNVLTKSQTCDGDMFLLSKIGNRPYNESCMSELTKLPQKLAWNLKMSGDNNTFYARLLSK